MSDDSYVNLSLPTISIVTPSYNQGAYLEQCIKSVVDQGYPNLQYIVVDGGSDDDTISVLQKYSECIDIIISEPDRGHAHALNKGFALCHGSIMGWINSDDILAPRSLWTLASAFSNLPDVSWVTGAHCLINKLGFIEEVGIHSKNMYDYIIDDYKWIQQESTFWRRHLWERAGGFVDENLRLMIDGELWCRFFLYEELYGIDAVLAGWRRTGDNRSSQSASLCLQEMEKSIDIMRHRLDGSVLSRLSFLRFAARIADSRLSRRMRVRPILWKLFTTAAKPYFSAFSYQRLRYNMGLDRWILYSCPFR